MSGTKPSRKPKRPATPSPLERAERAVVRAAMGWFDWDDWDAEHDQDGAEVQHHLASACFRLKLERQKARRAGR